MPQKDEEQLTRKSFSFTSLDPNQPKITETGHNKLRGIPFPDPLGILENITGGILFDPVMQGAEIKKEAEKQYEVESRKSFTNIEDNIPYFAESDEETQKELIEMNEGETKQISDKAFMSGVDKYVIHLKAAHRSAPCPGCKKLVESALVGAEVYREMERSGKTANEVKNDVENIRKRVMEELHG